MLSNLGCWEEDWKDPPLPSRDNVNTDVVSDYEFQAFDLIHFGFFTLFVVFSFSSSEKVTWSYRTTG